MNRKSIFFILMVMLLSSVLMMTACGKSGGSGSGGGETETSGPMTLEQYAKENPDVQKSIDEATADSEVEVSIKGNDVIYSFELSNMKGYTADVANDPSVKESLQAALDGAGSTFGGIAKTLEEATEISGIKVTVNYTYNGEMMATRTYDPSDAVERGTGQEKLPSPTEPESDTEDAEASEGDTAE